MVNEDYVSFETAKLLKEKGFDEECQQYYGDYRYPCPTLQMAIKWLREVHNIDIIVPPQFDNSKWTYSAIIFKLSIPCTEIRLNDNKDKKEQACEAAIRYTLENLI